MPNVDVDALLARLSMVARNHQALLGAAGNLDRPVRALDALHAAEKHQRSVSADAWTEGQRLGVGGRFELGAVAVAREHLHGRIRVHESPEAGRIGGADEDRVVQALGQRAQDPREGDLRPAIAIMQQEVAAIVSLVEGRSDQAVEALRAAATAESRLPAPLGLPTPPEAPARKM